MRVSESVLSVLLATVYAGHAAAEKYNGTCEGDNPVKLRIGNGGAGQSGLVKALAESFIKSKTDDCKNDPFQVEWVKGDTTETINNLKDGSVDIGITYHKTAEEIAISGGIAEGCKYKDENSTEACFENCDDYTEKPCYTFRDHFYLTGPKEDTTGITDDDDITETFSKIYNAAEAGNARFLSRFDKSATNIKDSELWINIGQVPWATTYSKWYHQYMDYPLQALKAAITLGEYTVTDRGTYLTLQNEEENITDSIHIYKSGEDIAELLNPADIIISKKAEDKDLASDFVQWVLSEDGQKVIVNFHKEDGFCLYKGFPVEDGDDVEPTECKWDLDASDDSGDSSAETRRSIRGMRWRS
ncbi:uncharacterized protein LDX57_006299 [Aspergillus melleus]|uniref:uncharacterized protein n=1 Tax=Aspergillus melleus TaxID=138277 RepID=UPI001E8D7B63|nr:uncharacterized protein LDX57_006299 [Aspergillus melleus]KAH8428603.1 hypothetical protein LDX57_006299 [Aspergillus melleus]